MPPAFDGYYLKYQAILHLDHGDSHAQILEQQRQLDADEASPDDDCTANLTGTYAVYQLLSR